jgi:GR25 family glycosyltransferase involved in LPS biosynthesis
MINLDRRPDRCEEFMHRVNEQHLKFPSFQRFQSIDGLELFQRFPKILDIHLLEYLKHMLVNQLWTDMWMVTEGKEGISRKGEIGCLLSHYALYIQITHDDNLQENDLCLILEDDIHFNDDFTKRVDELLNHLQLNKDIFDNIDVIWVAGRNRKDFIPKNIDNVHLYHQHKSSKLYFRNNITYDRRDDDWYRQTTAYLITKRGARRMIDDLHKRRFVKPIDHCMMEASSVNQYDWYPHIGYSPMNYQTDVQGSGDITPYDICRVILANEYYKEFGKF